MRSRASSRKRAVCRLPDPGSSRSLAHPFDPLRARRPRLEGVAKTLGLTGNLVVFELHNTHRVGRLAVIGEDEFADPQLANAKNAPHRKALLVRLGHARGLNVASAADALAGLRVFEHRIVPVNVMLGLEIIGVGGGPMAI